MKRLAVYCGAYTGKNPAYRLAATQLGKMMNERDLELVYGGGTVGLMGIIAQSVLDGGGKVHGIMPHFLRDREGTVENGAELEFVPNMAVRKQRMLDLSDACLALPGGPGTLEEIIEAFSWAVLGQSSNPCAFYNVDGYYTQLANMFDRMTADGYLTDDNRAKLYFSDSFSDIFNFMENYQQPKIREYD